MGEPRKAVIFALAPVDRLARDFEFTGLNMSESVVVPLDAGLDAPHLMSEVHLFNASIDITRNRFADITNQVNRDWQRWLGNGANDQMRRYFSYIFYTTRTPIVHWRMSVALALELFNPTEVYLYGDCGTNIHEVSSRDEFLRWARQAIVREAAPHVMRISASCPQKVGLLSHIGGIRPDSSLDFLWALGFKVRKVMRSLGGSVFRRFTSGKSTSFAGPPRVIVLGQESKITVLLAYLKSRNIPFRTVSAAELVKSTANSHKKPVSVITDCSPSEVVDKVFYGILDSSVTELQADRAVLIEFASRPWQILMTDHEFDPHARFLADEAIARGKTVVLTPEGMQTLANPSVRPYFYNWFFDAPGLTRFAVDEQEADYYTRTFSANHVIISGYLGVTELSRRETFPVLSSLVERFLCNHRGPRKMALVNVDHAGPLGLGRAGQQDMSSEILSIERLIFTLTQLGWAICVTSKAADSFEYLRSRFTGLPVWCFSRVNWQVLAQACDIVVQRDSSLGPEALKLDIPVLVWNECRLPLASAGDIESSMGMMTKAEAAEDLEAALYRALLHKQDAKEPKYCTEDPSFHILDRWFDALPEWRS
jgi:hypothetical protein